MRRWVVAAILLAPALAMGEPAVPIHHHVAIVGTESGTVALRGQVNQRSFLGLINASSNVVFCRVDGSDTSSVAAAADTGIRLAAAGTTGDRIFFDRHVPQGPVRCYSATNGSLVLITEGR